MRFKLNIRDFFLISSFIFVYCDADKDTGQRTSNSSSRVSIPYLLKSAKHAFFFVASFSSFSFIFCSMFIHPFTCTNTDAFNFTDPHGTCRCRFIFMQRGFTVVCIPCIQAAEVPFNNHTAVMPVTILLNFIVMVYQSPAAPVIHVRSGYLYFSLPLFAAVHCNSSRHWRGEGIVN